MRFNYKALIGIGVTLMFTNVNANEITPNYEAGKEIVNTTCATCHGENGISINDLYPSLAGQHQKYIRTQLYELKRSYSDPDNGLRFDAEMSSEANKLSEQQIADVALFLSKQKTQYQLADEKLAIRGEQIYRGGDIAKGIPACSACHSPTGKGNAAANYPAVAGQHAYYTEKQLNRFKTEERKNDPARIMRDIAQRMNEAEIKEVASYIQGLQP
ncbi:cytochrome c4 [Ignatzschineria rhizosphaerae]|uniref:Cytochrome c4 n=1 Tax=Ignatzschineria rhizosphaerae TaxID=2923279 RepID=A0ABY3X061_9GAMM|nr:c-type cytochrome [Ignatzschineria rhizosphaerae]UNM95151.1 cytochrome c4 [Ignatzschineria rhizosphaerae]